MKKKIVTKFLASFMTAAVLATGGVQVPSLTVYAAQATPTDAVEAKPAEQGAQLEDTVTNASYEVTNAASNEVAYQAPVSAAETVSVPDSVVVDGVEYKVTKIEEGAFEGDKTVTTVTLGDNIQEIGANAFSGCSNLEKVTIPKTATTIGANAFKDCASLKTVALPASVSKIGASAFSGCGSLKTLKIKNKNLKAKDIDAKAFEGVPDGTVIKVPKSKLKAYKKMFKKKGLSSKVKVKAI